MPSPHALRHELHLQMLRLGNRIAAGLICIAAILVNTVMRPDPPLAVVSLVLALALMLMAHLARPGRTGFAAALSLGLLGVSLSAMYLRGVTHEPAVDQALHGALLLPLVAYACLIGTGWRWLIGMTGFALGLDLLAYAVLGAGDDPLTRRLGPMILAYSIIYTLGAATVSTLVMIAHRRVLAVAEAEAEAARQRSFERQVAEARVRAVLDAVPNPIFAKDVGLRYVDCNAAFCAALGLPRERILGRTVAELAPEHLGSRYHEADSRLFANGGIQVYEAPVTWADGSQHPVLFHKALVSDAAGRPAGLVGMMVDLSEQRLMRERLVQAEKLEAIGRLAGGVAHDMNNQLAGILGFAELLAARLAPGGERDEALAIVVAAQRAADLPRRLLAFARKGDYVIVPVDLHRLVGEVCSLLGRSIDPAIQVEQRLGAGQPMVDGDPCQLQSLLLNLALNARDAMPEGGRLVFATANRNDPAEAGCDSGPLPPGTFLEITVSDTGTGMDEAVRRRLFEPFFTTKEAGKGTGLGLASVYGVVRIHHGAITVDSAPGRGSSFTVLLPVSRAIRLRTPLPEDKPPRQARRILVVDDESIVRTVVAAQLDRLGHEPVMCGDGDAALELIRGNGRIDGAIIDLVMPGMSGPDLFHRMRTIRPGLAVAISSGHHDDHAAQELLHAGAVAFIAKPHGIEDLVRIFGRAG